MRPRAFNGPTRPADTFVRLLWIVLAVGCGDRLPPLGVVEAIDPNRGPTSREVTLLLRSRNILPSAEATLGAGVSLDPHLDARLEPIEHPQDPAVALLEVTLTSAGHINARVPAHLAAGVYQLVLVDPYGRRLPSAAALTYLACVDNDDDGLCDPPPCVDANDDTICDDEPCLDEDGDGWGAPGTAASACTGGADDCDDIDADNWASCATCVDADGDGTFVGCDAYVGHLGPDCDDSPAACGNACFTGNSETDFGSPLCNDGFDNDCDGAADAADSGCAPPTIEWTAYNDLAWYTAANGTSEPLTTSITRFTTDTGDYTPPDGSSGELIDYADGSGVGVTLSVSGGTYGTPYTDTGTDADPGSDADDVFGGIINSEGVLSYDGGDAVLALSGLDPTKVFELVVFSNRGDPTYTDRLTTTTLSGANRWQNLSTPGATFDDTADPSVTIVGGYNPMGHVARFAQVQPGADGQVVLTLSSPDGHNYANALRVQQLAP